MRLLLSAWLYQCANDLSLGEFGLLLFILWSVWKERNDRVWDQKTRNAMDVSCDLGAGLLAFRSHQGRPSQRTVTRRSVIWKAPSLGVLKVNVDGAFNHSTRTGGLGFIIRDSSGTMVAGGACPLRGLISAEHAEILACVKAYDFVMQQDLGPMILETDALEVKRQLELLNTPNTSRLGRLYDDLAFKLANEGVWRVCHIGRKGNTAAHAMGAYGVHLLQDEFYFSVPSF